MIFAFSIGSDGTGPDRFTLYVPFNLAPGNKISQIDPAISYDLCGYELRFEELEQFYALTVGSFHTEKSGREFFEKIRSSLLWATLQHTMGIVYPQSISEVKLSAKPNPVSENSSLVGILSTRGWTVLDGDYDANTTVVRPEAKKLLRQEMGQASVVLGIHASDFAKSMAQALSYSVPENVIAEKKLQLAIDLYSGSFFEFGDNAKFIVLVTVLEALTPDSKISKDCEAALNSAKTIVKEHRKNFGQDSAKRAELDHLLSRLGNLKKPAIGASIRRYVCEIVRQNPALGDAKEVSDKLSDIYDHRSRLLHKGYTDEGAVQEALQFLRPFIPKLLERLYVIQANR